jgi:hypothetical protein
MSDNKPVKKKMGNPNFYKGMPPLNPKGRPKGSTNKYTELSRELMSESGPAIVNKVIEMAMEGDTTCLKMCMDRILPPKREIDIKQEDASINIVVEQIGTVAQKAIEDTGGVIIEQDVKKVKRKEKKVQDAAFEEIVVGFSDMSENDNQRED